MERNMRNHETVTIEDVDVRLLLRMIDDFTLPAISVEQEVARRDLQPTKPEDTLNWMALQTVSHFNLGTALELLLKLLSLRHGKGYKKDHGLARLYRELPEPVQKSLRATYRDSRQDNEFRLIAVTKDKSRPQWGGPKRSIATIDGAIDYFDEDVKPNLKRYLFESAQRRSQWRCFISNPKAFVMFIRRVRLEETRKIDREYIGKPEGTGTKE